MPFAPERNVPRPSLLAVGALLVGQVWAMALDLVRWEAAGGLLILAVLAGFALRNRPGARVPLLVAVFAALGLAQGSIMVADRQAARAVAAALERFPSGPVTVEGRVAGDPRVRGENLTLWLRPGARVAVAGQSITLPAPMPLFLRLGEKGPEYLADLAPGDPIRARGAVTPVEDTPQPGGVDSFDQWMATQGSALWLRGSWWEPLPKKPRSPIARWRLATRRMADRVEGLFMENLDREPGALLAALTLGRTAEMTPRQRDVFARTGLLHAFAVSGLHTGMVAGLVVAVASALGMGPRRRAWVILAAMVLFCSMTGFRSSVLRSALLVGVFTLQPLLRRHVDHLGALASVALALLAVNPRGAWQLDFQMSFLCALTLVLAGPGAVALREVIGARLHWRWWSTPLIWCMQVAYITTAIQLALLPPMMASFGRVSLIAPLGNIVALIPVGIFMGAGWLASILALAWPGAAGDFVWLLQEPLRWLQGIAGLLAAVPGAALEHTAPLPPALAGLYYLALLAGRWVRLRPRFTPLDGWASATGGVVAAMAVLAWAPVFQRPAEVLQVDFLDVGQGDAVLLRASGGGTMLVDTGPPHGPDLAAELRNRGVFALDLLVLTHADGDHIGGAERLIREGPLVRRIAVGGSLAETETWLGLARVVDQRDIPVLRLQRGASFQLSPMVDVEVLHPTPEFIEEGDDRNEGSVVLRVEAGRVAFLLTGDAERSAENDMLEDLGPEALRCDVLKAGHHGSDSSSTMPFLLATQARWGVISCGRNNRYGHPAPAVLARLAECGIEAARTDLHGTVTFTTDGREVEVRVEREGVGVR